MPALARAEREAACGTYGGGWYVQQSVFVETFEPLDPSGHWTRVEVEVAVGQEALPPSSKAVDHCPPKTGTGDVQRSTIVFVMVNMQRDGVR